MVQIIHDENMSEPRGFSHGVVAPNGSAMLFIAGQIATDRSGNVVAVGDMAGQFATALSNFVLVLKASNARPDQVVKITLFVKDIPEYQKHSRRIGELYREVFGKHYPAMTMVQIVRLVRDECLIEIEGIAVVSQT